jgi:putative glycerol-1-phosphate prenyltransferase
MLGMKLIYLEGGSGAAETVNSSIIKEVKQNINIPLIVGGGIKNARQAALIFESGADIIVVGNEIEKNPSFLMELSGLV